MKGWFHQPDWRKRVGWSYYIKTKETEINIEDIQKIVDKFPNDWFYFGESKRDEKPVKQDWGWSTIVDISNPWKNWDDEKLNQSVALLPIGVCYGSQQIGKTVCDFVVEQLKDLNYTILDVEFSY